MGHGQPRPANHARFKCEPYHLGDADRSARFVPNRIAFTVWMAGGGIKGARPTARATKLGFTTEEHPTFCYDLHATALHLLGIDHTKLSVHNNGIQRRLTDVHGHVIDAIVA